MTSAPYHPSTNGHAERAVQSFKNAMKKMDSTPSGDSILTRLNRFLFAYRTTPQTTTEMSPAELLMNRKVKTRLSLIKPSIQKRMAKQGTYEERPPPRSFSTGDWVWMRNYSKIGSKWIQGRIEAKLGPLSYHVQAEGKIHKRHVDQLRSCSKRVDAEDIVPDVARLPNTTQPSPDTVRVDTEPAVSVAPPVQLEEVIVEPEPAITPLTPNAIQDTPDEQPSRRTRQKPVYLSDYVC